jgi:Rrf2 family protein
MPISQKCQYALRALFEIAKRGEGRPVKIGEIAQAQAIPARFLENILNGLKSGSFVESTRGKEGGYRLGRPAGAITVGEVIRFVQGPISPMTCDPGERKACAPFGGCVFRSLWERAREALEGVYDATSLADLVRQEERLRETNRPPCSGLGETGEDMGDTGKRNGGETR